MERMDSARAKPTPAPKPAVLQSAVHVPSVSSSPSLLGNCGLHQRTVGAELSKVIGIRSGMAGTQGSPPPGERDLTTLGSAAADAVITSAQRSPIGGHSSATRPELGKHVPVTGAIGSSAATMAAWRSNAGNDPSAVGSTAARDGRTTAAVPLSSSPTKTGHRPSADAAHRTATATTAAVPTGGSGARDGTGGSGAASAVVAAAITDREPSTGTSSTRQTLPSATVRTVRSHDDCLAGGSTIVGHSAHDVKVNRDTKPPLPKHKPTVVMQRRQRSDSTSDAPAASAVTPPTAASSDGDNRAGAGGPAVGATAGAAPSVASWVTPSNRRSAGRSASFADRTPGAGRSPVSRPTAPPPAAGGGSKPPPPSLLPELGVTTVTAGGGSRINQGSAEQSAAVRSPSSASTLRERSESGSSSKVDNASSQSTMSPTTASTSSVSSIIRAFSHYRDGSSSPATKLAAGNGRSPVALSAFGLHPPPPGRLTTGTSARQPGEYIGGRKVLDAVTTAAADAEVPVNNGTSSSPASAEAACQSIVPAAGADEGGYLLPRCSHAAELPNECSAGGDGKTSTLGSNHHYSDVDDSTSKASTLASGGSSHLYEDVVLLRDDDDGGSSFSGSSQPDSQCQSGNGDVFCETFDDVLDGQAQEEADSSSDTESEPETEQAKQGKKKRKAYLVAEEMMKTEAEFCDNLKLLNEDFRSFVTEGTDAAANPIIPPRLLDRILNHLPQLQDFSSLLTSDLKQRVEKWESNPQVADIFVKKGPFLKLYTTYITEFERATTALDEAIRTYPAFAEKVREFESTERCRHLLLRHFMLKPIQRIPQYKLLLTDYLKYVTEDCIDHASAIEALAIVSAVAKHSNEAMKQDDSLQELLNVQNSLVGDFKVVEPSRKLLKKGELLKHSRRDKQVRMLYLFNDVLLIARPIGSLFKLKYLLPLQNMKTSKPAQDDYENEFTIISKQKSFAVVASNPAEREAWFDAINNAIKDHEEKLSSFLKGSRSYSSGVGDDVVGEVAPVWIPDTRVSMCMVCTQQFTVFFRRHHCRGCGKVVCSECSEYKAPLKYDNYQACRVCGTCHAMLRTRLVDNYEATLAIEESKLPKLPSKESLMALFRASSKGDAAPRTRTIKPSVLAEVHAGDTGAVSGYLRIFTKKFRWKRFWFVIKDHVLYKYNASQDTAAIESTVLYGYEVAAFSEPFDAVDGELLFKLHKPETSLIEPVVFRTVTPAAAAKWLAVMKQSVQP